MKQDATSAVVLPALVTKPDRLADRITNLSHPRDYQLEQVPADLFDNLPTEGQCQNRQSHRTLNVRSIVSSLNVVVEVPLLGDV